MRATVVMAATAAVAAAVAAFRSLAQAAVCSSISEDRNKGCSAALFMSLKSALPLRRALHPPIRTAENMNQIAVLPA